MKSLVLINTEVRQYRIIDPSSGETLLSGGPFRSYQHARRQLMMHAGLNGASLKWLTLWPDYCLVNIEQETSNTEYEYFDMILKIQEWDAKLAAMDCAIPVFLFTLDDNTDVYIEAKDMISAWHLIASQYANDFTNIKYQGEVEPRMASEKPDYKDDEVIGEQLELPF